MQHDNEAEQLALDPKHPGLNDAEYVARRNFFFNHSRKERLQGGASEIIEYNDSENAIWKLILAKLNPVHEKSACSFYLDGKHALGFDEQHMPQQKILSEKINAACNFKLIPAEGLIDTRIFFAYLAKRMMPATQYIRHHSHPEYTPEPDAVHDVIGHVPPLMNRAFVDIVQLIGQGVAQSNDEQIEQWDRVYWFTIEFGLIKENNQTKILGAGILSSFGEMEYCLSEKVERKPFDIFEVINTDYDPTKMQDKLYIIESLADLKQQVTALIHR